MFDENSAEAYNQANKKAKSQYLKKVNKGSSGHLPSLDGIISNTGVSSEISLGIVEIPLKKIVGTYSHSRSKSFSNDFLPLPEKNSEFASKWCALYKSHLDEGIRDAIKVYEYLNWFYVIEGNKRVSVLKYVDAVAITAEVHRLIPKQDVNDPLSNVYYDFLKFNKKTGIFTIWLSQEMSFSLLGKYLDKYDPELKYEKNKYDHFLKLVYKPFRTYYHKIGGDKLNITTGDALLEYIKIYSIPQEITEDNYNHIKALLPELKIIADKKIVEVHQKPAEDPKKKVLSSITTLVTSKKKIKVAFAYAHTLKTSGWAYSHDLGRLHVENLLNDDIETNYIENVPESNEAYKNFKKLAEDGNDIIFTTSPAFISATLKAALEYPDVKFMNCSGTLSYNKVRTYYGRIQEPKFLMGIIAGALTKTNVIGCLAKYPIPEEMSGANAFALGAKTVNPYIRVEIGWTRDKETLQRIKNVDLELKKLGADIIAYDDLPIPGDNTRTCGLYTNDGNQLALPLWHWGVFYDKLIRNVLNGTWKMLFDVLDADQKLLNFWWGMDSGIVDIFYSLTHIPREIQRLVDMFRKMIVQNEFNPFTGPIYDQSEILRFAESEVASNEDMISMNWLEKSIHGFIPEMSEELGLNPITDLLNVQVAGATIQKKKKK